MLVYLNSITKWLEIIGFLIVGSWFVSMIISGTCRGCQDISAIKSLEVLVIFLFFSILNSVRIISTIVLNQGYYKRQALFYTGILGINFCFIMFALMFKKFDTEFVRFQSPEYLFFLFSILFTSSLILTDHYTWYNTPFFIKFRVSLNIIHLMFLAISPLFGILSSMILVPIGLLCQGKSKPERG
jgi:hypothetical protein